MDSGKENVDMYAVTKAAIKVSPAPQTSKTFTDSVGKTLSLHLAPSDPRVTMTSVLIGDFSILENSDSFNFKIHSS